MGITNAAYERGEEKWERASVVFEELQSAVRLPWESSLVERQSVCRVTDEA